MKFEVRKVPYDWIHPKNKQGYIPLFDEYTSDLEEWLKAQNGTPQPDGNRYMPDWPKEKRTHYQLYEVSDDGGVPASPLMENNYELATWLAEELPRDKKYALVRLPYVGWLEIIKQNISVEIIIAINLMILPLPKELVKKNSYGIRVKKSF